MNGLPYTSVPADDMMKLKEHFESFQKSDHERQGLVQSILDNYARLQDEFFKLKTDYDHEMNARRTYQQQCIEKTKEVQDMRQQTEGSQFALVLIDGDGCHFLDHFLKLGSEGGAEAAHQLDLAIKGHLRQRHESTSGLSIIVHVYANFDGLARKLAQVGITNSPADLHDFAKSFSFNQSLFSFIDVGRGKERADHKIKEMLRLYIGNVHCKHIIFGGCHDYGYLPNLEPYRRNAAIANRITLLESTPAVAGYRNLGLPITSFDTIFRDEPLPENRPAALLPERVAPLHPPGLPGPASPSNAYVKPQDRNVASQPVEPVKTPSPGLDNIYKPGKVIATSISYATAGKVGNLASKEISIQPKPAPPRKFILLNPEEARLDPKLPQIDAETYEKFAARIRKQKVCNNYHINGSCRTGSMCNYSHEPRLSSKEVNLLRARARQTKCPGGSYCRDPDCFLGHMCQNQVQGGYCSFDTCKFKEYHKLDQTISKRQYEDEIELVGT